MVSNVDLAPTIADLAEAQLLRKPDGVSLVPELKGGVSMFMNRSIYVEGHAPEGRMILPFDGVVSSDYLYYEFSNGESEFYDIDPTSDDFDFYELNNLISSDPSNVKIQIAKAELERKRQS